MKILQSKLLRWVISLILVAMVVMFADWREVWHTLRMVEPVWVAGAIATVVADRLIVNLRWMILLSARGVRTGFLKLMRIQLAANFLGSFLPGSLGVDAIRIAAFRGTAAPMPIVIAATMVDRISLAFATLLAGALMLLIFANTIVPPEVSKLVMVGAVAMVLVSALCLLKPVRNWVRLTLVPFAPKRFQQILHEIADASLAYRNQYRTICEVVLITVLLFAIRIWFVQLMALAVGIELSFEQLAIVIPILWLIVMLPISVGGVGVQDASYIALLAFLGLPASVALSISLMEHILTRLVSLPGVFFVREAMGGSRADPASKLYPQQSA